MPPSDPSDPSDWKRAALAASLFAVDWVGVGGIAVRARPGRSAIFGLNWCAISCRRCRGAAFHIMLPMDGCLAGSTSHPR